MEYTEANFGTQGAKRQSLLKNPRPLLKSILDDVKNPNREKILKLFRAEINKDPMAYLDALLEYWFHNNYSLMTRKPSKSGPYSVTPEVLRDITENVRLNLTLGMMMPNGKPLKECTGAECIAMGKAVGPFLIRLGQSIGSEQKVKSKYRSDNQIKKFWDE